MLARGGNAIDAAIATAVALTVVEPVRHGIGSDAVAIVASGGSVMGLNASGRAPAGRTEARFANLRSMSATGWDSVTVPGAVSA
jgi:gamma-glutamyltranspeptidase/glutathione hydrolase